MLIEPDGHQYPSQRMRVHPFDGEFVTLFPEPVGQVDAEWPPPQMKYMGVYLKTLGCRTIVHERHYIDRHYIEDFALFYARSLRNYPNFCQRLHFFSAAFDGEQWCHLVGRASKGDRVVIEQELATEYLGFMVIKPLPGSPIGRTVLKTFGPNAEGGAQRTFATIRPYPVNLAGLSLSVDGLAFQQQDQGVSACATTALWSALQCTARMEDLASPTPAAITEAASRYVLTGGRALPSEGLDFHQLCEAVRASGLAPVFLSSVSPSVDKVHLATYLQSGLPVLLGIEPFGEGVGHALCGVGLRLGDVDPRTNPEVGYVDGATAVEGIYVHDDRLGPYASAELKWTTLEGSVVTTLELRWPDNQPVEEWRLLGMVIPVPMKLRLSSGRLRAVAHEITEVVARITPRVEGLEVRTRFCQGTAYRASALGFDLSLDGLLKFMHDTILSRYVGVIELMAGDGPVVDVILDATETTPNPAILAIVRREGISPTEGASLVVLAELLGATSVS